MVYFVGAGSGAVDLITVRGKNLLEQADVIIYAGSLVNPELLDYKKEGVSAFCGAASALNLEYTLPGVSQSAIITRMAGRTPVPERERIASFAAHQATMVVFLSTGLLEELSRELIVGGYTAETPAAIVYKATWKEEEKYICTVGTLAQTAKEHNITKTALMIIGEAVTHSNYARSELYNPNFSTEYRKAKGEDKA